MSGVHARTPAVLREMRAVLPEAAGTGSGATGRRTRGGVTMNNVARRKEAMNQPEATQRTGSGSGACCVRER